MIKVTVKGVREIIVYADILIILNLTVNYFLLLATDKLLKRKTRILRLLLSAVLGAIASLYIFLPKPSFLAEAFFKISLCLVMAAIGFGIKSLKQFFKASLLLFCVTCGYAGIMIAIWHLFKPRGMVINNSVVYFNISPLVLVGATVGCYFVFIILNYIFKRSSQTATECEIKVQVNNNQINLKAILDSGNSLEDIFGKSEIIITEKGVVESLFGNSTQEELNTRFRAIPCNTVSGSDLLDGYRCDSAFVSGTGKSVTLEKPILAVAKTSFNDGYNAIVNPKILD